MCRAIGYPRDGKLMRRTPVHILSTLLLMVSYLWGGCISCEQFFMRPGKSGDCCKARRCDQSRGHPVKSESVPKSAPRDCQIMPMNRVQATQEPSQPAAAWLNLAAAREANMPLPEYGDPRVTWAGHGISGSPPDLPLLNCSFRL